MLMEIEKVRNLTDEDVYVYGTSGALVRLPSEPYSETGVMVRGRLPEPKEGEYYIMPEKGPVREMILKDWHYSNCAILAVPYGQAHGGEKLSRLKDYFGKKIELVSDGVRTDKATDD